MGFVVLYVALFFFFGYRFTLSLVEAMKMSREHFSYKTRKHLTAMWFVLWSVMLLVTVSAFLEGVSE